MAALETLGLEHLPVPHRVHLALFRDVQNAVFLHEQLLARNTDFEYALIDASILVSRVQLLAAVFKATHNAVTGALKTPNVHSETVVSLSPSSNIAESYRRYGITPSTKDLVIVKITIPTEGRPEVLSAEQIWEHLQQNVEGEAVLVTDENITSVTDLSKVRKYYKLNNLNWLDNIKDEQQKRKEMEMLVISAMALRGV